MADCTRYIPYSETGSFSRLVNDYTNDSHGLGEFYTYSPTAEGVEAAIKERRNYPIDRQALTTILNQQYERLERHEKVVANIAALNSENTYTVCTAHQPNLLTGYLYFIYKIIHAIKLADELGQQHPGHKFVPVYYMGSEDNDIEELGTFRYGGDKYIWDGDGQEGAVGRMATKGLKAMLHELFRHLGPPGGYTDNLINIISVAYLEHDTIGKATQYLVNELFGRYGLVVLDPDEPGFKRSILPVMKDELLHQAAQGIINKQIAKLGESYKIQAQPRAINLFYLADQVRERIEQQGDKWVVLNTDIEWNEAALLQELDAYPERFSPNVMLRGILQETILPDVAFIGGGAEVAYWMQLKTVFKHYNVFYPAVFLRQSVMWVPNAQAKLMEHLQLSVTDVFKPQAELAKEYVAKHSNADWHTTEEKAAITSIFEQIKQKATALDATLQGAAEASLAKMSRQLDKMEHKMLRAEKRKMEVQLSRVTNLKASLFPNNGLQERVENFISYFPDYGYTFFDILYKKMNPFANQFLVIEGT